MVGTAALLGVGAAIVQAVFPGIIKRHFPKHVGIVTGLYSSMLMGGGAQRFGRTGDSGVIR
jgi:CP family cyanate transporter-like MFS transporter